jgi:secondary thiamine-phosphate synthase enzyme
MRLTVPTGDHTDVVDITDRVESALPEDAEGVWTVFVEHTTAGVRLNEAEPRLLSDIETFVDDLAPDAGWEHDRLDGNADSHLRALLLGSDVSVPVAGGELDLGTWQSVLLIECDGPRERTVRLLPP